MKRASLVPFVFLTAVFFDCRDSAFSQASKKDSIESYRQFIGQHPMDENIETAQARLEELELDEARRVHTVVGYKRYLEEHPGTEKAHIALALLEGLRFNAAKQRGTPLAWRQFIKDHPDGTHREEAEALLARAELADLSKLDDADLARIAAAHQD